MREVVWKWGSRILWCQSGRRNQAEHAVRSGGGPARKVEGI